MKPKNNRVKTQSPFKFCFDLIESTIQIIQGIIIISDEELIQVTRFSGSNKSP